MADEYLDPAGANFLAGKIKENTEYAEGLTDILNRDHAVNVTLYDTEAARPTQIDFANGVVTSVGASAYVLATKKWYRCTAIDTATLAITWEEFDGLGTAADLEREIEDLQADKNDKITATADDTALSDTTTIAGVSAGANPVSVTVHSLSKFWTYISGKLSGNYKTTQTAKTDPTASGTTITAIDTISQNAQGVITATKKTIRSASISQTGVVQLNNTLTSTSTAQALTAAQGKALNDSKQATLTVSKGSATVAIGSGSAYWAKYGNIATIHYETTVTNVARGKILILASGFPAANIGNGYAEITVKFGTGVRCWLDGNGNLCCWFDGETAATVSGAIQAGGTYICG